MDEQAKNKQNLDETAVGKEADFVENTVDNEENAVEGLGTKNEEVQSEVENVENAVDMSQEDVEETVDNGDSFSPPVEIDEKAKNKGGIWWKIILGIVLFGGLLAYCAYYTKNTSNVDIAITYAKDNALYVYDLENTPYMVKETISNGGTYNYYYTAWGADVSKNNKELYFLSDIDKNGVGTLSYKNIKDIGAEVRVVAEGVVYYLSSADGEECAYLVENGDKMDLYVYYKGESRLIAEDISQQNGAYEISSDGNYVLYNKSNGNENALYASAVKTAEVPILLSETVALNFIAEKTSIAYYLEVVDDTYLLYEYTFGKEAKLVDEQVTYVEPMPNGRDILYCAMRTEDDSLSQLIEDDVTDLSQYDAARQKEIEDIRSRMTEEEGMDPIFQDSYILSPAGQKKVYDNVISVASVEGENGFVAGYCMEAPAPSKLSEIKSFEDAMFGYYASLMYGEKQVFVADATGAASILQGTSVTPTSVRVSADGSKVAYLTVDETTGESVLMVEDFDGTGEAVKVQTNVEQMQFLGESTDLVYYYNYQNGTGTIGCYKDGAGADIQENAVGLYFADDRAEVYFLADPDMIIGNGTLMKFDGDMKQEIGQDVFSFHYKENGTLTYFKDYKVLKGIFDLYYYNSEVTTLVDSDVTAVYMY
ncbi:MAG: hypothetical protein ACK5I7_02535 [Anaerotignum sp.]